VPVSGVTMQDCVEISKEVGQRVGEELGIPVYLYEESARKPEWRSLANIRVGEYEALPEKMKDPEWKPDFGPHRFNARAGATAVGAREFLIAYNINLNTRDKQLAMDIAFELREKGRSVRTGNIFPVYMRGDLVKYQENRFPCGNCDFVGKTFKETREHCKTEHDYDPYDLLDSHGSDADNPVGWSVKQPGKFKNVRAIGWYVDEYKRAQITINFTNYKITLPHIVVDEARKMAAERGLVVTGCEIVGLVPFPWIYEAGKYYLQKQGKPTGVPVADVIEMAIFSLGLNDVAPFNPQEKILGLPKFPEKALVEMKTRELVHEVSRDTPAPGGGSIAALAGSLGAALASMVSNLTIGKKGYEAVEADLLKLAEKAQSIKDQLLKAVDDDTNAFNAYMEATRMPNNTPEEKKTRTAAIQDGLKQAVKVPLNTANLSLEALKLSAEAVQKGNVNSVTDAGVGAQIAFSGVIGGNFNVLINLPQIKDEQFKEQMKTTCANLEREAREILDATLNLVKKKIDELS
jgi:glutamate formiminotransferase/formiminotetrahydrofolate cyclodeaminase